MKSLLGALPVLLGLGAIRCLTGCGGPDTPQRDQDEERATASELTAADAPPRTFKVDLTSPHPLAVTAAVLEASNSVQLAAGTQVQDGATVAMSATGGGLDIQSGASARDAWGRGLTTVGLLASVHGTLHASKPLVAIGAKVDAYDRAPVFDPANEVSWTVTFPAAPIKSVIALSGATQNLLPGRYDAVNVLPGGTLTLHGGVYDFTSFNVAPLANVQLDQATGPVVIYVSDLLALGGNFSVVGNGDPDLLIAYFGALPVSVGAPSLRGFRGTLLAPSALLTLLPALDAHAGFFAARDIIVGPLTKVKYGAPLALVGVAYPDPADCAAHIPVPAGTGRSADLAYQAEIARYCTMPGTSQCIASLVGRANVDYTSAAQRVLSGMFSPAQYLGVSRDRSRKLRAAQSNSALANGLCTGPDSDGDWVTDPNDQCPGTPELTATDDTGCPTALPAAPAADDVKKVLDAGGILYNPACIGASTPAEVSGAALYQTANPDNGIWISAGRVNNQPAGCDVWYLFEIRPLLHGVPNGAPFSVAFAASEQTSPVAGIAGLPEVPRGVIQFHASPGDPGTRGMLGGLPASPLRANFRVQAINGNGVHGAWSQWKLTSQPDCHALGITCAIKN